MYCILVTGIPASGKSTLARALGEELRLPVISKDSLKELLFDHVGFRSREEKVRLGNASMEIMYAVAGQLMRAGQPFLLENNFEHASEDGQIPVSGADTAPDRRLRRRLPAFPGAGIQP